jgi:hypothetical protein
MFTFPFSAEGGSLPAKDWQAREGRGGSLSLDGRGIKGEGVTTLNFFSSPEDEHSKLSIGI